MARKVVAQNPQRRTTLNRAQLKALAAQQAMTNAPARSIATSGDAAADTLGLSSIPISRRRPVLTREQEYAYIRADLIRLVIVAALLLIVLIGVLLLLDR